MSDEETKKSAGADFLICGGARIRTWNESFGDTYDAISLHPRRIVDEI